MNLADFQNFPVFFRFLM